MVIRQKTFTMRHSKKQEDRLSEGLEIIVARSLDEIETIRPLLEQMQTKEPYPAISTDIDRYLHVLKASGDDLKPYVMLIKKDEHPVAMVIGRIAKRQLRLKFGYKTLCRPSLNCLTIVYNGILCQPVDDLGQLMIRELMRVLRRERLDAVYFNRLRTDSDVYQFAREVPGLFSHSHFSEKESHWIMVVPKDIKSFYKARSKKHRGNIRRSIKKLETEYTDGVEVVHCKGEDGLDGVIKAASQVSLTTYQHGLGCGFVDDSRTRDLLTTAAKQTWLRFAVMFVNGQPGAFQIGLRYQGTYFLQQIGFDPRLKDFNVGTILFVKVLEHICADPGIQYIDFGFGDADYKRSYGDKQWLEASIYIFAPRPYPIFINMLRTFVMGLNAGLEYILDKTGLVGWIKRHWRNSLQVVKDNKHKTGADKS